MKRRVVWFSVVVSLLAVTYAQSGDANALKKLEGRWKVQSAEKGGEAAPPGFKQSVTFIFAGDKLTLHFMAGGKEDKKVSSVKLDTSKTPNGIDVTPDDGPEKGKTMPGIFELKGGTLKLSINDGGKERPTKFASPQGSQVIALTLAREKAEKKDKK